MTFLKYQAPCYLISINNHLIHSASIKNKLPITQQHKAVFTQIGTQPNLYTQYHRLQSVSV